MGKWYQVPRHDHGTFYHVGDNDMVDGFLYVNPENDMDFAFPFAQVKTRNGYQDIDYGALKRETFLRYIRRGVIKIVR